MEANKILKSDFLDLLFENRNKDYGAYELRRYYNRRIGIAMLVMFGILFIAMAAAVLRDRMGPSETAVMEVKEVELQNIEEEEPIVEPPPPPPPKTEPPPQIEMTKFTPPLIVKDEEVKKEDVPPPQENLADTKIDVVSQEGIKSDIVVPPVDEGKGVVAAPKDDTDYDQTFTKVEVEAEFPGGQRAWARYLERNLDNSVPANNGAPAGSYRVVIKFIVDKEGNISDVSPLTSFGYGLEQEAIRVIKRGPKWTPAVQNGRSVKAYRTQPITFIVSEE